MDKSVILKINYEISEIDILVDKSDVLISLCKNKEPDFIEITAIGGILQSFYNGIENIFVLIAKSLNFDFKTSPQWHRALIDFMFAQPNFLPLIICFNENSISSVNVTVFHPSGFTWSNLTINPVPFNNGERPILYLAKW